MTVAARGQSEALKFFNSPPLTFFKIQPIQDIEGICVAVIWD